MKFSASQLKNWQKCALQSRFNYIDNIPQETGSAAWFGSAVHEALDQFHKGKTEEEAIEIFRGIMDGPEPDYWNRQATLTGYKDTGPRMIHEYCQSEKWKSSDVIGSEIKFMIDFGEHQLSGIVDYLELPHDHHELRIVDFKTGRRPILDTLYLDIQFCADTQTELLTKRGWKRYDELVIGEEVLTLNQTSKFAEWQPLIDVHTFNAVNQELVSIESISHSSLTTKNHRWPVEHIVSGQKGWRSEDRVVNSEDLTQSDRIYCSAPVVNLPVAKTFDDDLVELLAWLWTEGTVTASGNFIFSQSYNVNKSKTEQIISLLTRLYGPANKSMRNGKQSLPFGCWRLSEDPDCTRFYLNKVASESLAVYFEDLKNKVLKTFWISKLTHDQLELFVNTSISADGHEQGYRYITQSHKGRLEVMQIACSLLGIRTSLKFCPVKSNGKYNGYDQWKLTLKEKEKFFIPRKERKTTVVYSGVLWCPRTGNQTWFARRKGQVYFTGNTIYDYASRQKEFWCGHPDDPEKYAGLEDGEELFEYFENVPRKLVWYDLKKNQEVLAGARQKRDYARLYRLCEQVARAIEHEVYIPTLDGDTCTYCPYTDICPVYF